MSRRRLVAGGSANRMSGRRLVAGLLAGGAVTLSLAACGHSGNDSGKAAPAGSGQPVAQAADVSLVQQAEQKVGRIDTIKADITMSGQVAGHDLSMKSAAQLRLHPTLAMAMTIGRMSVDGRTMPGMSERLIGDTLYIRSDALAQQTGGKPWARLSLQSLTGAMGLNFNQLVQQADQGNPADQIKKLLAAKDLHKIGVERVNGVSATHYAGTVSFEESLARFDAKTQQQLRQANQLAGVTSTGFNVWIGPDGLPVSLKADISMATGTTSVSVAYHDYGKPVDITAPPADQVGELRTPPIKPTLPPAS